MLIRAEDVGHRFRVEVTTENDGGSLRQGASGAYDQHFRQLAADLVAKGQGNAILRLGWEFNGDWYPWKAETDPAAFAEYWRRIHGVMRSVPGAQGLRFDWNPAIGPKSGWTDGACRPSITNSRSGHTAATAGNRATLHR